MVYGFILVATVLVGAIFWLSSTCSYKQGAMWSPGGGVLKPEPWLQTNFGGYSGWEPGETQYSDWAPGAYLQLFTPTTTQTTTTEKRKTTTTKRKRRPITFPSRLPSNLPPSSSSEVIEEITETPEVSISDTEESEELVIPPSELEPPIPPGDFRPIEPAVVIPPKAPDIVIDAYDYDAPRPSIWDPEPEWRANDQNEEAYEERPRDLTNTRPPDKLPVGGWGYEYDT